MKLIAFTSFKGGSGKSTTLMAVASILAERGMKVACFEADDNEPLATWRDYGNEIGTWDEAKCAVYGALDLDEFEKSYEAAEKDGCQIGLIDTRGGGSDLNQAILMNASLIVIPTGLSVIEIDEALETLRYVVEFMKTMKIDRPVGLSLNRVPMGRLSKGEESSLDVLKDMPTFDAKIPARRIYSEIKGLGLLHLYHKRLTETPSKRIAAGHTEVALIEMRSFTDELLAALEEDH